MNNEVKLKGLAGLAHLLSPGADWAYDNAARNVRDYVKEQTLALAAKDAEIGVLRESLRSIAASLIKYGQHHAICEFMNSRRACTCGFIEATDYASQEHSAALSKSPASHPAVENNEPPFRNIAPNQQRPRHWPANYNGPAPREVPRPTPPPPPPPRRKP